MFNFQDFRDVFSFDTDCSYSELSLRNIEADRKKLEGLFIEKLLKLLGLKRPTKFYPPKSNNDLKALHKAIVDSHGPDHYKISVLYYVLLDFDAPTGRRELSTAFERKSFLPQKYQIYMKGLWHLDRLEFEAALQYLTHPSLIPTFPEEILEVLVAKSNGDVSLALAYYHTAQPALAGTKALEDLYIALVNASVTEAFYFCRSQTEYAHRRFFELMITGVLDKPRNKATAERCVELVNLPFSVVEETWFEDWLLRGGGRSISKGKDTLLMRRIGTGNFKDSLALKGIPSRTVGGLDWNTLTGALEDGLGPRLRA